MTETLPDDDKISITHNYDFVKGDFMNRSTVCYDISELNKFSIRTWKTAKKYIKQACDEYGKCTVFVWEDDEIKKINKYKKVWNGYDFAD